MVQSWCDTCGNFGVVECLCGGDLCVCENYGAQPCPDCDGGDQVDEQEFLTDEFFDGLRASAPPRAKT